MTVRSRPVMHLSESRVTTFDMDEAADLRRSFISALIALVGVLAWLTAVRASLCRNDVFAACGWLTTLALSASALLAYVLRKQPGKRVTALFVICLLLSNLMEWLFLPSPSVPYFFSLVVIAASMLFSARGAVVVTALSLVALCGGVLVNGTGRAEIGAPVVFLFFASAVAGLGTRQFMTALSWASFSGKQAQAAARDAQHHRAQLVARSHDLEQAYSRMERMNQMLVLARQFAESARVQKSQFANAVSHELRSPINMVVGFVEMMVNAPEMYVGQQWTPRLTHHLAQVHKSAQHLSQLIDDVLDLARIDSYRMSLNKQPVQMQDVIAESIEITRELYAARGLYLRAEIAPGLPALALDQIRIRQVLLNLITNAARFTQSGGVTVRASLQAGEIHIAVEDTGSGIAAAELEGLFQEFHQLGGNLYRQGRGSSGLGLVISKRLIEQHGGRLWAESEPELGSRFVFALPLQTAAQPLNSLQPGAKDDGWWPTLEREARKRMRLLVRADAAASGLISASLSRFDLVWLDPEQSIGQQIADQYPVALVCVGAPGGNGRLPDVATRQQYGDLPVIVCTLPSLVPDVIPPPFCGALIKPVSRDKLQRALAALGGDIKQILLVDDDPGMTEFLRAALASINPAWRVHSAADGKTALQAQQSFAPEVILLDFGLPDMSGRELAFLLSARQPVQILAVTAEDLASAMTRTEPDTITVLRAGRFNQPELENVLGAIAGALLPSTNQLAQYGQPLGA